MKFVQSRIIPRTRLRAAASPRLGDGLARARGPVRAPTSAGRIRRTTPRIVVVGAGDVGLRLISQLNTRYQGRLRVIGIARRPEQAQLIRDAGAKALVLDLDSYDSVKRLRGVGHWTVQLAPPPAEGLVDHRTKRLAAVLAQSATPWRQRWIYASTSGVYGDCAGALIDETQPVAPTNARAVRRVSGERLMRKAAVKAQTRMAILRVPGIYDSAARLPIERLRNGLPALLPEQDVYTNHIHADDLAWIVWLAMLRSKSGRIYHATDNSEMKMGEYFDAVATRLNLPLPPRLDRETIKAHLSPAMMSFLNESRRLKNDRLLDELRVRLRYPTVADTLAIIVTT
jgi:nucleoside-diphosphate-sugar epimerase